jgi:hypothetical protein
MKFAAWLEAEKGRAAELAAHFGKTPAAISHWKRHGVPVDLMKSVRDYSRGAVTLEEMVPDAAVERSV